MNKVQGLVVDGRAMVAGADCTESMSDRARACSILRAARTAQQGQRDELTELAVLLLPDCRPALRLRVRTLIRDGNYEAADALIARGLLIKPHDAALMELRGRSLALQGRLADAEHEITRLLRIQPQRAGALVLGGQVALQRGNAERAVLLLTRARLCRPLGSATSQILAEALIAAGQPDEAIEVINTVQQPLPLLRARALAGAGRWRDAAETLSAAIEREHDAGQLDQLLAESLAVAERRGSTEEIDRRVQRLSLATPLATLVAAKIALARGQFRRALLLAAPLRGSRVHGAEALPIMLTAAAMLQRHRLARLALARMRLRYGSSDTPVMRECWRRATLGRVIDDQKSPRRASADPSSSVLQPLMNQASTTLAQFIQRQSAAGATVEVRQISRHYRSLLNTLHACNGGVQR